MNTFLAVFNALPAVLASVQAVETAIPLPQAGKQKLNLVLNAAAAAYEIGQAGEQLSKGATLSAVQNMVNISVAALNASGVFKQSAPTQPALTPLTPAA